MKKKALIVTLVLCMVFPAVCYSHKDDCSPGYNKECKKSVDFVINLATIQLIAYSRNLNDVVLGIIMLNIYREVLLVACGSFPYGCK
jgi:hypothetical protein